MSLAAACILAGGLGTRLGTLVADTPKPLLPVAGEPFVFHQLRLLRRHGAERVVLCVGYRGDQIEAAVGDGRQFALDVVYSYDGERPAGTAGAVRTALPMLGDHFLVLYGDTYLRVDYRAVEEALRASGAPGLMTVLHNTGRWDASNVCFTPSADAPPLGLVTKYDKTLRRPDMDWIDYGLGAFTATGFRGASEETDDLATVYQRLAERGELAGFAVDSRFYEIGTPGALAETDEFLRREALGVGPVARRPA